MYKTLQLINETEPFLRTGTEVIFLGGSGLLTKRHLVAPLGRQYATIRLTSVSEIRTAGAFRRTYPTASLTAALCFAPRSLARW